MTETDAEEYGRADINEILYEHGLIVKNSNERLIKDQIYSSVCSTNKGILTVNDEIRKDNK